MDFDQVVKHRRMCRDFRGDPVEPTLVDRLLRAASRAPSAGNTQGWAFLVVDGPAFWAGAGEDPPAGIRAAPLVVVPLCSERAYRDRYRAPGKKPIDWTVPYWTVDCSFATMLLLLAAADAGLGALFFRLHQPAVVLRSAFGVPDSWEPIGAVALGWPAGGPGRPSRPGRRPLSEIVHRGAW